MKKNLNSKSGIFNPRALVALTLGFAGVGLTILSFAANSPNKMTRSAAESPGNPVWAIVNSPNVLATRDNYLNGVTCVSTSDCWAVGYHQSDPGGAPQTLIEQWDGAQWSIVPSPNKLFDPIYKNPNSLYGVTCVSASDCWAVGDYTDSNPPYYHTLIEQWDGTQWSIVTSPTPTAATDYDNVHLSGVTCASAS